uniref:Uncharacterized protein n=1 Tax=Solibacter usitatus (strain Ellin6076) TaxID=234267 RepID=Q023K1_SOLUE
MKRLSSFTGVITVMVACGIAPAFGQTTIDIDGVTYNVATKYSRSLRAGPRQAAGLSVASGVVPNANLFGGLQFYTANYTSFGKSNAFNIVGTDPSLGAGTTTVPVVIVPIRLTFNSTGKVLDGTNQGAATVNSPIFLTADFTTGGTDVGVTQYGDAIQRAQFWNFSGFSPAGYHVLLGAPTVAPTISITVTTGNGTTNGSGTVGVVLDTFLDPLLTALVPSFGPNVLPIFLTDNVFESADGTFNTCCTLGYHASEGPPVVTAHTWIYAAYTRSGTFSGNVIQDVQPLSHEVSEWVNDPFVGAFPGINLIPPAVLPGQGGACIINFETGDPLEAPPVVFTEVTNGTTYHLQDEVFLWWYTHGPSFGVNGFFSYTGKFLTSSSLCGPG